jgi:3-deoxy-D-manno-octulosonic acid kinase
MLAAGLRVPAPIAALCDRDGRFYRAALITRRITPVHALADLLSDNNLDWALLGAGLREFHDAGVDHADLNARNILVHDETQQAWLIDFDRSSFTGGTAVDGSRNLARLKRSLDKLWPESGPDLELAWASLLQGYQTQ